MINSCIGGRKRRRLVWIGGLIGNLRVGGRGCVMSALRPKSHLPTMVRAGTRTFVLGHFFFFFVFLFFLRVKRNRGDLELGNLVIGAGSLLRQWIARNGWVPIVVIGMAGLALDIGTREWKSGDTIVADAPVVAEPPVVAETFVERRPPTEETTVEPTATMQLTAPAFAEDS